MQNSNFNYTQHNQGFPYIQGNKLNSDSAVDIPKIPIKKIAKNDDEVNEINTYNKQILPNYKLANFGSSRKSAASSIGPLP